MPGYREGAIVRETAYVCRDCGAPRDFGIPYAKCRRCYDEYMRQSSQQKRRKQGQPERKFGEKSGHLSDLTRAYERLGLEPGKVWKLVPR